MKSEGYIWLEYIDRKGFEFEEILRLLSLLNGEEGEEEVGIFSKIMRLYKSNKEKERKKDFDSVSLKFEVKKVESRKVKSKRESFKKFTLFNFTYYYYYSIPEFILPSPLWKLGEQSPNRKSEETGADNRPTVDETGASGTLELGNGRDKFGIGDSKRD